MRYLSVCSGIEAASVAWQPLGWHAEAFAEIEVFPSAVLKHHYPSVPNRGDMTRFQEWPDATFDVLVGGTPCQSFSVAGLRKGLADPRGNLALTYLAVLDRYRPTWCCWENVPGVLSADGGRALGAFLGGLGQLGYGFCGRVLDAQYFGLAQRRKRLFVVGHLGDWRRAAAVLFERESLQGHPAPCREAWERVAPCLEAGANRTGGNRFPGTSVDTVGTLIPSTGDISHCLNAGGMGRIDYETETLIAHSLRADGFDASEDGTGRGTQIVPIAFDWQASAGNDKSWRGKGRQHVVRSGDYAGAVSATRVDAIAFSAKDHGADAGDLAPTLRAGGFTNSHANGGVMPAVAFHNRQDPDVSGEVTHPLGANDNGMAVAFSENQRGEITVNDTAGSLKVGGGKPGQGYPAIAVGEDYAGAYEADASSVLSTLRKQVGAEAVAEWGSRILNPLQRPEILRSWLHGESLRRTSGHFRSFVDDCPLPRAEGSAAATLRQVWENGPDGRSPQGRGLAKQLARQLGKALPELPHARAPQPSVMQVRRLTPRECERLMGFPDDYTLIPYRGKLAADGPRYKALGNSMAVPVMAWIGRRIALMESVHQEASA